MKRIYALLFLIAASSCTASATHQPSSDPVDSVSPNIGGIGQLLTATIPYVQYPHGMARLAPITTPGVTDRYLADKIYGFPAGAAMLMASTGAVSTDPKDYASDYDHDFETATPYYYAVRLEASGIEAEFTATAEAAYYRFTFPANQSAHLVLSMGHGGRLEVPGDNAIEGSQLVPGLTPRSPVTREYVYAEFSRLFDHYQTWHDAQLSGASSEGGDNIGFVTDGPVIAGEQIQVRLGISYISTEQARRNLMREIPGWGFDRVKANTREVWEKALDKIAVSGGSKKQRTIFYTALYRSLGGMTDITEDGNYYSGFDSKVHAAEGHDFYVNDIVWDTYRSLHPLQLLLDAHQQDDIIRSYLRMYEQSGWLPSSAFISGGESVMIGHHVAALITDAYMKGYRDFDVNQAYAAMKKNATEATMIPWQSGSLTSLDHAYFEKGFFPALTQGERETVPEVTGERRQAVSVTLETSYDDWCVAQMAKALGRTEDYDYFLKLAHNYSNVYNPATGFMAPKGVDGEWIAHFNPKLSGGQGGRDYTTEVNTWIYSFNVQHDPAGLIQLMGGRDAFNRKLDQLFSEQYGEYKFVFLAQFPDATGLVGLYAQGNEPSFHIPYLYDFSGQPWKTQKRVRQLMDIWYGDGLLGIPGDEDNGEMSSWYVLSALGFYPVCPGSPVYEIGSPIFSEAKITMGNGKVFTITTQNVSAQNKYIQSAYLNGKRLDKPWFVQSDIAGGGSLTLRMGPDPNTKWGSNADAAPPSMTN
jgi:predicted alpha-1,2-mannosidase